MVVGAPYWALSFPAALKVYLEWSSVLGITFRYAEDGRQVGLSRARSLVYLTTAGGPVEGQNYGFDYLRGLAGMFGIRDSRCVAAENLDVWGTDVERVLCRAEEDAAALARVLACLLYTSQHGGTAVHLNHIVDHVLQALLLVASSQLGVGIDFHFQASVRALIQHLSHFYPHLVPVGRLVEHTLKFEVVNILLFPGSSVRPGCGCT